MTGKKKALKFYRNNYNRRCFEESPHFHFLRKSNNPTRENTKKKTRKLLMSKATPVKLIPSSFHQKSRASNAWSNWKFDLRLKKKKKKKGTVEIDFKFTMTKPIIAVETSSPAFPRHPPPKKIFGQLHSGIIINKLYYFINEIFLKKIQFKYFNLYNFYYG